MQAVGNMRPIILEREKAIGTSRPSVLKREKAIRTLRGFSEKQNVSSIVPLLRTRLTPANST